MLAAVVLAAGASSRMRFPKALLLDPDGLPFVARVARTLQAAGVSDIVVVTGVDHDATVSTLAESGFGSIRVERNPHPARGQLSSLLVGMDALVGAQTSGLLVTLVDIPLVRVETVRTVVAAWEAGHASIVRPAIGERHGHPVIFDRRLFAALREAPFEQGAKHVVRAHAADIENVPVQDPGCLVDVDTPEEYAQLNAATRLRG